MTPCTYFLNSFKKDADTPHREWSQSQMRRWVRQWRDHGEPFHQAQPCQLPLRNMAPVCGLRICLYLIFHLFSESQHSSFDCSLFASMLNHLLFICCVLSSWVFSQSHDISVGGIICLLKLIMKSNLKYDKVGNNLT